VPAKVVHIERSSLSESWKFPAASHYASGLGPGSGTTCTAFHHRTTDQRTAMRYLQALRWSTCMQTCCAAGQAGCDYEGYLNMPTLRYQTILDIAHHRSHPMLDAADAARYTRRAVLHPIIHASRGCRLFLQRRCSARFILKRALLSDITIGTQRLISASQWCENATKSLTQPGSEQDTFLPVIRFSAYGLWSIARADDIVSYDGNRQRRFDGDPRTGSPTHLICALNPCANAAPRYCSSA